MLTIRQAQKDALDEVAVRKFEDELVAHLKSFSPRHCEVMGESAVRQVIRLGVESSKKYGFTNRGPVRLYVELMFMFGSYFDTDPQHAWAGAVLNHREPMDQMLCADRLHRSMENYLAEVSGSDDEYLTGALERWRKTRLEEVEDTTEPLLDHLSERFRNIYPQNRDYLGDDAFRALIERGFQLAEQYGLRTRKGMALMAGLTFALGHGFHKDPLYGWIARRLNDPKRPASNELAEDLHSKAMIYLDHALAAGRKKD